MLSSSSVFLKNAFYISSKHNIRNPLKDRNEKAEAKERIKSNLDKAKAPICFPYQGIVLEHVR